MQLPAASLQNHLLGVCLSPSAEPGCWDGQGTTTDLCVRGTGQDRRFQLHPPNYSLAHREEPSPTCRTGIMPVGCLSAAGATQEGYCSSGGCRLQGCCTGEVTIEKSIEVSSLCHRWNMPIILGCWISQNLFIKPLMSLSKIGAVGRYGWNGLILLPKSHSSHADFQVDRGNILEEIIQKFRSQPWGFPKQNMYDKAPTQYHCHVPAGKSLAQCWAFQGKRKG